MISVEFYLARITPQSSEWDPNRITGGIPVITVEEIRAAISMSTRPAEYHVMMTKYCQDRRSEETLVRMIRKRSGLDFLEAYPKYPLKGEINQAIAESAVIYFANPHQGERRGDLGNSIHAGVARNTWRKYYRDHFKKMTALLFHLETEGIRALGRGLFAG
jgi:hypothetical protein